MAALTVQSAAITGTTLTANAASTSDTFTNNGRNYIIVYNGSGDTRTFTAVTTQVVETTLNVDDRNYSVEDGSYTYIGTFSTAVYGATVTINNWDTAPSDPTGVIIFVFGV